MKKNVVSMLITTLFIYLYTIFIYLKKGHFNRSFYMFRIFLRITKRNEISYLSGYFQTKWVIHLLHYAVSIRNNFLREGIRSEIMDTAWLVFKAGLYF